MATLPNDDLVLKRFRAALAELYGERLERAVLFGSRARSEARPDSDYDVAVFMTGLADRGQELNQLAGLSTEILYELGGCFHALAFPAGAYHERTPLMHEVRSQGLDL